MSKSSLDMHIRIGLFLLAVLMMAAHFFRAGNWSLVALCLAAPLLFFYKKRWSLLLLQLGAYCASATWLAATLSLVQMRQQSGRSWTAAFLILGSVMLLTLLAGLLLNSRRMREAYPWSAER
ncbi:MAG: hypothetical protein WCI85_02000 [Comamonadaceae bacterium]